MLKITLVTLAILGAAVAMPTPDTHNKWGHELCGTSTVPDAGTPRYPLSNESQMIVGGWETLPYELPYQVALLNFDDLFCGGALASFQSVITAAHCLEPINSIRNIRAIAGDINWKHPNLDHERLEPYDMALHPKYNRDSLQNDLAVLTFEKFNWYAGIGPICPPTGNDKYAGQIAIVSGWGHTSSGGQVVDKLRAVDVPVMSNADCKKSQSGILTGMLCAGYSGSNEKDACQGDSGGPLAVKNSERKFELVGIVSWGIGCAGQTPGVYTEISRYEAWLTTQVKLDWLTDQVKLD